MFDIFFLLIKHVLSGDQVSVEKRLLVTDQNVLFSKMQPKSVHCFFTVLIVTFVAETLIN